MDANQASFWALLAPSIGALIAAVAAYIRAEANARIARESRDTLAAVNLKVDGQLTKSREDAASAVQELNVLKARLDSGEIADMSEVKARDLIRTAKSDAAKLLEVAVLAAAEMKRRADELESKLGPAHVKAVALDAVHEAVGREIARTPAGETRKADEHASPGDENEAVKQKLSEG
jgi:hypothetical protein